MLKVCGINLKNNLNNSEFERLVGYLSSYKQNQIRRFHQYEDAMRTLLGDILVKHMISETTYIEFSKIDFNKNEYGKPFLNDEPNIHFNISHSGEWVVAVLDKFPVGIDIEKIQPINLNIAKRFFSDKEYDYILSKSPENRLRHFYDIWTLKESYIKADGKGLSIPLKSFSICINDYDIFIETEREFKKCYFKLFDVDKDYKMAVCNTSKNNFSEMQIFDLAEFYDIVCRVHKDK